MLPLPHSDPLAIEEQDKELPSLSREVCFGAVPDELAQRVRQLADRKRLEELHRRATVVESLDAFRQELR